ncbi:MAG TPA: hypothetical protein DEH22_15185 [Chloroflexi bacterium]|nr:hypothetical protein [Chloroflexota bacterium]
MDNSNTPGKSEKTETGFSEQRILDVSPAGSLITRISDGTILYANKAIAAMLGIEEVANVIGTPIPNFYWNPDERKIVLDAFQAQGSLMNYEMRARRPNDIMFWVSISLQPFEFEGETALLSTILDITEKKQAEQSILALFNAMPQPVLVTRISDGTVLYANEHLSTLFGLPLDQIAGRQTPDYYVDPTDRFRFVEALQKQGHLHNAKVQLKRLDGSTFWAEVSIELTPYLGEMATISVIEDISERIQAEAALQQLATIVEVSKEAIMSTSPKGEILSWNPAAERMFGYNAAELIGKPALVLAPPEVQEDAKSILMRLAQGETVPPAETVRLAKDGRRVDVLLSASAMKDETGKVIGFSATLTDITERKQADVALRELAAVVSSSNQAIFSTTPKGMVVSWNPAAERMFGYSANEIIDHPVSVLAPPELQEQAREMLMKLAQGQHVPPLETIRLAKDGTRIDVMLSASAMKAETGQVTGFSATITDITDRKKAEAELRQEKALSDAVINGLPGIFYLFDVDGNMVRWNEEYARVQGYDFEEIATHNAIDPIPDDEKEKVAAAIGSVFTEGQVSVESHLITKDGEKIPYYFAGRRLQIGDQMFVAGAGYNIADREKAETELRASEQRFVQAFEITPFAMGLQRRSDGIWVLINKAFSTVTGYEPNEVLNNTTGSLNLYASPNEAKEIAEIFDQQGHVSAYEFSFRKKSGEVGTAMLWAEPLELAGQKHSLILVQDVTQQKQIEQDLRDSEEQFRTLFDRSSDAYLIIDEGIFVDCNQATVKMLRANSKDEVLSTHPSDLSPEFQPDGRASGEKADEMMQIALDQGSNRFEWMHQRLDGEVFPVEVLLTPIPVGHKTVIHTIWRDISVRKRLQQETENIMERRGYQVQISTEIAQEIVEVSEISELYEKIVSLTKERLGYYHTQLLQYQPTQDAVVLVTGYGEIGHQMQAQGHHMPMGSGLIGTAAATGETIMRPTLADDPDWQPNPLLPDTKGEIAVPIKLGDEILGVLDVQSDRAGALSDDDRLLLEGLCGQIAVAMEQTRLREEMEERLDEINRLYRAMSREGWESFRQSGDLPSGFQYDQTGVHPLSGGQIFTETFANMPMTIPGGGTIGSLEIAEDPEKPLSPEDKAFIQQISEQVALALESARLFEQTQSSLAETQSLYRFNQAISGQTELEDIYQAVARMICDEMGFSGSWIALYEPDNQVLRGVTGINIPEDRLKASLPIEQATPATLAAKLRQSIIVNDPQNDAYLADLPMEMRATMGKAISIPIKSGEKLRGVIAASRPENGTDIGEREERMLQVIGNQLAIAIERTQLFEQTQAALAAIQESEAQLSEALEIARLGNFEYDVENDLFTFNDHFYSIFHTTVQEIGSYKMSSGDYAQKFVYSDDLPMVGDEIGKALSSTERFYTTNLEHRIKYADGGVGYISVNVNVERDENGRITRYYGANQDITERKLAEEAVRQAQERAQTILETVTLPMVITRLADGLLTFANPPAAEITGVPLEELVDSPAPDFYANPEERTAFVGELSTKGFVNNMQVLLKRSNQSTFWSLLSARTFTYQGEPSILTTITDISERIAAQEATAKRAAELATVAQIGTTISTILQEEPLLETVVLQTRERFDLYHCHIFLADQSHQTLHIKACGWEAGSSHTGTHGDTLIHIDQEKSLVAQAARSQEPVIVNDVLNNPNWLPNELLPNTRSEMAIPLIAGNNLFGILDVQSNEINHFTQEDVSIMTTLASQVSVALQNARTYAQTQQQAENEAMINLISQRIQSTTSVENALQVAIRELGRALGAKRTNIQLGLPSQKKTNQ